MIQDIEIKKLTIATRHRTDLGDIAGLARSIEAVGLLHPVVIDRERNLIAGARRVAAYRELGRSRIPAHIIDTGKMLDREAAENVVRLNFAPDEVVSIGRAFEEREKAEAKERQGTRTDKHSGKFPAGSNGRVRDKVAAAAGVSGRTYEKAKAVVEAAEENPEKFGDLLDEMKKKGSVNSAHRKLGKRQDEAKILSVVPIDGIHKTLIVDPPWDYGTLSLAGRAAPTYATMSHEELLTMPVQKWADDNCHLYLWTTNNFIARAVELVAAWGFQHKTVLTWVKPRIGLGSYFRNSTEQVLFAVRGDLSTRVDNIPTHFEAPVAEHSEKPDEFYDIVLRASYPNIGEAFQRKKRDGIVNLYEGGRDA